MFKVCKIIKEKIANRGSSTVEMCFIMPLIIILITAFIYLFLYIMDDGRKQAMSYVQLYTYNSEGEVAESYGEIYYAAAKEEGRYGIDRKMKIYKTEYGVRTGRLRRWQLYGDVLSE